MSSFSLQDQKDHLQQSISQVQKQISLFLKSKEKAQYEINLQSKNLLKKIDRLTDALNTYKLNIDNQKKQKIRNIHEPLFFEFKRRLKKASDQVQNFMNDKNNILINNNSNKYNQDSLSKKNKKLNDQNTRQVIIKTGDKLLQQGTNKMKGLNKDINQMMKQAQQIQLTIDEQIEKLDKIDQNTKQIKTTLQRAQHHLRYFGRQVYQDKIMICLIIFIVVAIIVIIVLSIMGKIPKIQIDSIK